MGGSGGSAGLAEGGAREDLDESLAIPMANLDDFSFGDSNHFRLCRAIVTGEVVSQVQMHFRFVGVIPGCARAQDGW